MKILLLTDGIYPFQLGGMQKHSLILARLLADHGIYVHLVHCGGEGYSEQQFKTLFTKARQAYITETVIAFPKMDPFPGHYLRENKRYSNHIYDQIAVDQKGNENPYDLVYAQGFTGWEFIKERKAGNWNVPVVVNFHGFEMFQKPPSLTVKAAFALLKGTVRTMIREADYVYSFGGQIHSILQEEGVSEERLMLQSNGIDHSWLVSDIKHLGEVRNFVFIGRYERRKGIEELNQVLELLISADTPFRMTFIGPIPENKRIVDERITYAGEVRDEAKMKQYLREVDCLLCPSHSEGMPTVILEGMASGLAIIATDVGAVSRQVSGNGILLPEPDVILIKEAIQRICRLPASKVEKMQEESLRLIREQFLWQKVIESKIADFEWMTQAKHV